jgi:hypothetical protein
MARSLDQLPLSLLVGLSGVEIDGLLLVSRLTVGVCFESRSAHANPEASEAYGSSAKVSVVGRRSPVSDVKVPRAPL